MKNSIVLSILFFLASTAHAQELQSSCAIKKFFDEQGNTTALYRRPQNPKGKKILIMPPTGGANVADRSLAQTLCRGGLDVVIFDFQQTPGDVNDFGTHDRLSLRALNSLNAYLEASESKYVVVGSSLGGIYASMAFGAKFKVQGNLFPGFQKIQGAVLTVAGGSVAEILTTSNLSSATKQREVRMKSHEIKSLSEYQEKLSSFILWDSLELAEPKASDKILFFVSSKDVSVPTKTQEQLWRAWGQPKKAVLSSGHSGTIARVYFLHSDAILKFSRKILMR
jgi:hypothetical protein